MSISKSVVGVLSGGGMLFKGNSSKLELLIGKIASSTTTASNTSNNNNNYSKLDEESASSSPGTII
jgi:hypothetical protein